MNQQQRVLEPPMGLFVAAVTALVGIFMLAAGMWALLGPASFAQAAGFPLGEHFLKDAGAFKIGIGVTLLAALRWRAGLSVALLGFLVSNTVHAANHWVDLHAGGHPSVPWLLAALSVLTVAALALWQRRLRQPLPLR